MAYDITTKDGITIRNIPDDVKPDDPSLKSRVAGIRARQAQEADNKRFEAESRKGATGGFFENLAAGSGKAISDIGLGVRQLYAEAADKVSPRPQTLSGLVTGQDNSRSAEIQREVDDRKRLDAPLMDTAGGMVGNVGTQIGLAFAPGSALRGAGAAAKFIPGVRGAAPVLNAAGKFLNASPATMGGAATQIGMGAVQGAVLPTGSDESRSGNVLVNAVAGGLVPVAGMGLKTAKAVLEPMYSGGREAIVGRAMRSAVGDSSDDVIRALRGGQELVPGSIPTAAEVANSGGIAALQRAASAIDPQSYAAREAQQNAARVNALMGIAQTPEALEAAARNREAITSGLRNTALDQANYGTTKTADLAGRIAGKNDAVVSALQDWGRLQTEAAQSGQRAASGRPGWLSNADRSLEASGAASDVVAIEAQRKAERAFLERQLNSLQKAGYSPLQVSSITNSIDSVASKPGLRASTVVQNVMGDVREQLAKLADKSGNIDARDLYTVRKEIGNKISKYAKENADWDKRLTAGLERDLQKQIDAAIEKAGAGDLWKQYLTSYQQASKPINQMQIGQAIADRSVNKLKNTILPNAYANSLTDDMAASATGFDKAKLADIMTPRQMGTLNAIRDDLARSVNARDMGRGAGSDSVQKLAMTSRLQDAGVPTFLMNIPQVAAADRFLKSPQDLVRMRLAEALLNPQEAAKLMQNAAPNFKREAQIRALMMAVQPTMVGGTAGLLNAQ